jgi:hypothetical protein
METKKVALIAIFSALCIVVGYARGVAISFLPGLIEFMTVLIFVSGFMFGWQVGTLNGAIALAVYMLVPYPFAHPGAWMYSISPILLVIMSGLGAMYGLVGGIVGRKRANTVVTIRFIFEMALYGLLLTFAYDILSSVGFYLAYPAYYASIWQSIYFTFIPLWLPYPPIAHTLITTLIFAIVAPPLIIAIGNVPLFRSSSQQK